MSWRTSDSSRNRYSGHCLRTRRFYYYAPASWWTLSCASVWRLAARTSSCATGCWWLPRTVISNLISINEFFPIHFLCPYATQQHFADKGVGQHLGLDCAHEHCKVYKRVCRLGDLKIVQLIILEWDAIDTSYSGQHQSNKTCHREIGKVHNQHECFR